MQCTAGTEKSGSGTTANWPTYHFMNNVTKDKASGALLLEPLNDANAIAEYKGIYHVMMQVMIAFTLLGVILGALALLIVILTKVWKALPLKHFPRCHFNNAGGRWKLVAWGVQRQ